MPQPDSYRPLVAPLPRVGIPGQLSLPCAIEVGSLDFVTRAGKRRGQNRARDNSPRKRQKRALWKAQQTALLPQGRY